MTSLARVCILPLLSVAVALACVPAIAQGDSKTTQSKNQTTKKTVKQNTLFSEREEWPAIRQFIQEMVKKHDFDSEALTSLFEQARYSERSTRLIQAAAPSSKPKDWQEYRARFLEPSRIQSGVQFWNEYASALRRAEATYGVPAEIITAIIGVETRYGQFTGNFSVIDVLTTLGFDYPKETRNREARQTFFRKELEQTLVLARSSHLDPLQMSGSFAGAIGLPQFMPSSILAYGVDFDGDGKIDLENSAIDAIGSVANFLKKHGWTEDLPYAFPVTVPDDAKDSKWKSYLGQGLKTTLSIKDVEDANITSSVNLPNNIRYGLIDLENGTRPSDYWLATNNFYAITYYNRSYFYAMSIIDVSQAIANAKALASKL